MYSKIFKWSISTVLLTILTFTLAGCSGLSHSNSSSSSKTTTTSSVSKAKSSDKKDTNPDKKTKPHKNIQNPTVDDVRTALGNDDVATARNLLGQVKQTTANASELDQLGSEINTDEQAQQLLTTLKSEVENGNQKSAQETLRQIHNLPVVNHIITNIQNEANQIASKPSDDTADANKSDSETESSQSSEAKESSSEVKDASSLNNNEINTVLDQFKNSVGLPNNQQDQFNISKIGTDLYQIEIRENNPKNINGDLVGLYRFNSKTNTAQKMNPTTGAFGK